MKRAAIIFLQGVIVLIGIGTLGLLLWEPHMEGVNQDATTLSQIYLDDPFLAYAYAASIVFFMALYQAFRLLGYIARDEVFSEASVKALRTIKYCAAIFIIFIAVAGIYIRVFHAEGDDPAGFLALCIVTTFISLVIATAAAVFEKTLQSAVEMKSENDLTV